MTTHKRRIVFILAILLLIPVLGFSETIKIDPVLTMMTQGGANLTMPKKRGILKSVPSIQEPLVRTILRFKGSLSGVESLGGRIRSIIGDIATVDIPLSAVNQISQLPNIIYIEAAKMVKPRLDISVPDTGADILRSGTPPNWTGSTGKNVVIGIVDSGIDLNHPDFQDPSGKTRILSLWDQSATTGTPPSGFTLGNECTKAIIDVGGCPETDTSGHGTHVSGIAAGDGSATGNGLAAFRYIGMAPKADLIVVKTLSTNSAIFNGIAYIQAKAAALGKPSVINLSLGSHMGPHDGTSTYERGLDNASGTGKVIVASAGNEAVANIHASGTVVQGGTTTTSFNIPVGSTGEQLNIWYAGADQMGIILSNGICTTAIVNPGDPTFSDETACGLIQIQSSGINPLNGDREIMLTLQDGTNPLMTGAWSFTLSGISITNGRFDAWSGDDASEAQFTNNIDPSMTLIDSATATKTITVGSYVTKNSWQSMAGPQNDSMATVFGISSFSSRGPRRACSDTTKCPSVQKPEITAPGQYIMSAFSANTAAPNATLRDPDGVHTAKSGTSMAAPHVTGAVALMLQTNPTLTSDQVKNTLFSTTFLADASTGPLPNNTWGNGVMDAGLAVVQTPAPTAQHTLTLSKDGTGTGTVTSSPAGISCGTDCTEIYADGTVVTLTASPDAGSTLSGWSGGGCIGTGNCVVTLNADTTVTATFTINAPPSAPALISPTEGQTGLGTTVTFKWKKSSDPDGDSLTYDFAVCEDAAFTTGCNSGNVASLITKGIYYASLSTFGAGLFFGIVLLKDRKGKKKIGRYFITMMIASTFLIACGDGGGDGGLVTTDVTDEISHTVQGLKSNTPYFWKVTANDGKGGKTASNSRTFTTQ